MPFSNLGLASDKILSLTRISGTGEAGSLDTYRMTTRAGENFDFSIQNGRNSLNGINSRTDSMTSLQHLAELQTEMSTWDFFDKIVAVSYVSGTSKYEAFIERSGQTCTIYRFDNSTGEFVRLEDSFFAGTLYVYYDGTPSAIDTEIDPNSANPVQNSAVAEAISVGVANDFAHLTETQGSYASDAALASAIENYLPFHVRNEYVMRYCGDHGNDIVYAGVYESQSGGLNIRITYFNTDEHVTLGSDVYSMASTNDIDNLFIEEEEE